MSAESPRILVAADAGDLSDEAILKVDARVRMTNGELVVCTVVPGALQLSPFRTASAYDVGALQVSTLRSRAQRR